MHAFDRLTDGEHREETTLVYCVPVEHAMLTHIPELQRTDELGKLRVLLDLRFDHCLRQYEEVGIKLTVELEWHPVGKPKLLDVKHADLDSKSMPNGITFRIRVPMAVLNEPGQLLVRLSVETTYRNLRDSFARVDVLPRAVALMFGDLILTGGKLEDTRLPERSVA